MSAVRRVVNRGSSIIELIVSAFTDVRSLVVYRERSSSGGESTGGGSSGGRSYWSLPADASWMFMLDILNLTAAADCPSRLYLWKEARAGVCSGAGGASALTARCRWYGGLDL